MEKENLLIVNLTATHPTRFELTQLRTLLIHLDANYMGEILINHEDWLEDELAGNVGTLEFTAKITPDILSRILGAIKYSGITLSGTINGEPVSETIYSSPILETDADICKARATAEQKRAAFKAAESKARELTEKFFTIGRAVDAALGKANIRRDKALAAMRRADEKFANCIRNKTILYYEA